MASTIQCEVLIIGAGVIGSSVAAHLAQRGVSAIRVIDLDLEGQLSSSELNAGGVRATFNLPINTLMSRYSIDFFARHAQEVGYRPCGYLWLHSPSSWDAALSARDLQSDKDWPVEALDLRGIVARAPFIDKTEGIAGGIFAVRDGLLNPNLLKNYFRSQARLKGAVFDDGCRCVGASYEEGGSVRVTVEKLNLGELSHEAKLELFKSGQVHAAVEPVVYQARQVVNCAGAWAAQLAQILGYYCPSFALRRQISLFESRSLDLTPYGMIVDTSGVYFHPEATQILAGYASTDEPRGVNYRYDGESFFLESIWPALYERSTGFEQLKHVSGWAGQYEVSPDETAILGQVQNSRSHRAAAGMPARARVFEAHSFSGHGVMHAPAAGMALAELIVDGKFSSLDLSELTADRFEAGRLLREGMVI